MTRLRQLSPATIEAWESGATTTERAVGEAGSVEAGSWVRFAIGFEGGRVTEARFKVYGCPHTLAAAAWFAEQLRGRRLEEVLAGGVQEAARQLEVPVEKLGRLLIIEDALRECQRRMSRTV
ncbi:MAG TPA: iron-sulfur cluster assembly scaffold protein [Steroidobacteraceae bacterium]